MRMPEYQHREPTISEREIERKYAKLEIKPADANRVNCYRCPKCAYVLKTIDIHYGVTPMMMRCDCCGDMAMSSFYKDIAPDLKPEKEWFVPTLDEVKKMKKNPAMLDHIFNGGLEIRKINHKQF